MIAIGGKCRQTLMFVEYVCSVKCRVMLCLGACNVTFGCVSHA